MDKGRCHERLIDHKVSKYMCMLQKKFAQKHDMKTKTLLWDMLTSGVDIKRSNISWYFIAHYNDSSRTSIRLWTHSRPPISIRWLLWVFWVQLEKTDHAKTLYMNLRNYSPQCIQWEGRCRQLQYCPPCACQRGVRLQGKTGCFLN